MGYSTDAPVTYPTVDNLSVATTPYLTIRCSQVDVCWSSLSNTLYQVQFRSALTGNDWTNLGSPIAGNGANNCISDPIPAGQPARFYRVVVVP